MYQAAVEKITLEFKNPAGTSRGVLKTKNSWIFKLWKKDAPNVVGLGEASIIENLSPEWDEAYEAVIEQTVSDINDNNKIDLSRYPSIQFALEAATLDLENGGNQIYFNSDFTQGAAGIQMNGLIWMGDKDFMRKQIIEKIENGYGCLKLKIGAIDFDEELALLRFIRSEFSAKELELRVDANGAFQPKDALNKLNALSEFQLHSIEQPIQQGLLQEMASLCEYTPIPIALDEELIGIRGEAQKATLLKEIMPQYIILKPSLVGGFKASNEWIKAAEALKIGWWITSALEANIGLNAIAQYTATKNNPMPQGLGTGQLFVNNIDSNLYIESDRLFFRNQRI